MLDPPTYPQDKSDIDRGIPEPGTLAVMNDEHIEMSLTNVPGQAAVRMRGPADMAELLPYLMGFYPDDSIVAVGLQGPGLHQGGVIRVDIPDDPDQWGPVAKETVRLLVELSEQRACRPKQVLLYLCRDIDDGDRRAVVDQLAPLAGRLAGEFQNSRIKVKESLCVASGRWWSFLCADTGCCDPAGTPVRPAHLPSAAAAAATFAGLAPRGSRKAILAELVPIGPPEEDAQRRAIDRVGPQLIRELAGGRAATVNRTAILFDRAMADFRAGARTMPADHAARLLVGLQDRLARDRGAEYVESGELGPAQCLWRFLVQRCVPPFERYAVPPMTLLAWTAWVGGDTAMARVVLSRVLEIDPGYTLAALLHESINSGLHPEALLASIRRERAGRPPGDSPAGQAGAGPVPSTDAEAAVGSAVPSPPGEADAPPTSKRQADSDPDPGDRAAPSGDGPTPPVDRRAPRRGRLRRRAHPESSRTAQRANRPPEARGETAAGNRAALRKSRG